MSALIPVVAIAAALGLNFLVQRNLMSRYDYRCGRCGSTFSLAPAAAAFAPHRMGGSKYVRCPSCGSRSWASPVPKR